MSISVRESLSRIVRSLTDSYSEIGHINHLNGINIPSKSSVVEVLHDIQSLIFPGYYTSEYLDGANITYYAGEKCWQILKNLTTEICKSLQHTCNDDVSCVRTGRCKSHGHHIALKLLRHLPQLRLALKDDVEATLLGDPAAKSREEVITCYPGLEAIAVYRVAHFLHKEGVPLIPRIMSEHIHGKTGIDIHPGATIGRSFFIDHGTGVVVGETTIIGDRVKIYQGVTLGALSVRKENANRKRHPTIEDDVTIYSGATILGGETVIGHGAVIGGNVWLTESVPPYSKVVARSEVIHLPAKRNAKLV